MAKRNKKGDVAPSRSERRGPPGPSPLLVIAGLPQATAKAAAATIKSEKTRWKAVTADFPNKDEMIYYNSNAITDLLRQTCAFAITDLKDADGIAIPSRIVIAYVVADGSDSLWDAFGHSVWPIPLSYPDDQGTTLRRHWRFEIETVNSLLRQAIRSLEGELAETTRLRLEARRTDDALLLPGRNFHLGPHERLVARYRAFMRGELKITQVDNEVCVERFSFERLSDFYSRTGGRGKRFAIDHRGLVFAKSQHGQHGGHHDLDGNAHLTQTQLRVELEGRFRFGTPLEPPGFQHDVQREGNARLIREQFNCARKGLVEVTHDHANIFANDVVTAANIRSIEM